MGDFKVTIEGDEPEHGREPAPKAEAENLPALRERTRAAISERNRWLNEAKYTRANLAASQIQTIDTQSNLAAEAANHAIEVGDYRAHTEQLAKIAELKVQRSQVEQQRRYYETQPDLPDDPVEAFIASRDPDSQAWLRAHMDDAHALATHSDPRRVAKINAADNDAVAEGYERGSKEYFAHVESFLGMRNGDEEGPRRRRDNGEGDHGESTVKVLKRGEAPVPGTRLVKMSKREYELATDGSLTWETGPKRGQPLGVAEYLRRKGITDTSPEWKKLD
jgi:hypothetical protein